LSPALSMALESSAVPAADAQVVGVSDGTESIAAAHGPEYGDVDMLDGITGACSNEAPTMDQWSVEGIEAAPLPSGAAQFEPTSEASEQPAAAGEPELYEEHGVDGEACQGQPVTVTDEELERRLLRVVIGDMGEPGISGEPVRGLLARNSLLERIIDLVHTFFDHRKKEVRWVSPTAQLDRYEAIAYIIADLLDLELLLEEARPIGKRVQEHIRGKPRGVLARADALKGPAKDARSNARAKAKKDAELAATLERTIADIDAKRDDAIAALKNEVYEGIGLPPANSVIVKTRPAPIDPEPELTAAKLAVSGAEADLASAELEVPKVERIVTKMRALATRKLEETPPKRPAKWEEDPVAWWDKQDIWREETEGALAMLHEAQDMQTSCMGHVLECRADLETARRALTDLEFTRMWVKLDVEAAPLVLPTVQAPKVFSLVGMSADEVSALAGQVSQQTTTAEEHAAFGRSAIGRLLSNY
jgi:hypothetical protein